MKIHYVLPLFLGFSSFVLAQKTDKITANLEAKKEVYSSIAQQIWGFAEMGYQEEKSAALLQETLSAEGFKVTKSVAGIPTAFIAEYGEGLPVIAILGEYDAYQACHKKQLQRKSRHEKPQDTPVVIIYLAPLQQRQRLK